MTLKQQKDFMLSQYERAQSIVVSLHIYAGDLIIVALRDDGFDINSEGVITLTIPDVGTYRIHYECLTDMIRKVKHWPVNIPKPAILPQAHCIERGVSAVSHALQQLNGDYSRFECLKDFEKDERAASYERARLNNIAVLQEWGWKIAPKYQIQFIDKRVRVA